MLAFWVAKVFTKNKAFSQDELLSNTQSEMLNTSTQWGGKFALFMATGAPGCCGPRR